MGPIEIIRMRLGGNSGVDIDEGAGRIEVMPRHEGAFPVTLLEADDHFVVCFGGGWHETFDTADEAVACFGFGLSEACRLEIRSAGDASYRWTAQSRGADGAWIDVTTVGLLVFPFWRSRRIEYLQNRATTAQGDGPWRST